ncbi:MAG TPA: hypothetical protein VIL43_01890 [Burkholderiales bacterium]
MIIRAVFLLAALTLGATACERSSPTDSPSAAPGPSADLDALARQYVQLALAFDRHDPDYVDAYFGEEDLLRAAEADTRGLPELRAQADALLDAVAALDAGSLAEPERLRLGTLAKRLRAMRLRMDIVDPERDAALRPFDEESRVLFDAVAPDYDDAHFEAIVARIDALVPGEGPLRERLEAYRAQFVIPPERLEAVFGAAIEECRRRTLAHIELPAAERFTVEYVTDKPWNAYNWYQGGYSSLIQINTDLPIRIERAVDLGCHEGYPGHHVQSVLLERELVEGRGWPEFALLPLFGPQAPLFEGGGNYGVELAFPAEERLAFERDVLFPLAGLDPSTAERYHELLAALDELRYARNEAARDYLNGDITREQAAAWQVQYALLSEGEAARSMRFIDTYRSYVINYNLGEDLVRGHVETLAGADPQRRWAEYERLLSLPFAPSDLVRRQ